MKCLLDGGAYARALDNRTLQLARRIAIARESALGDMVIEVVARGRRWFCDKAKRNEAAAIGFHQTPNCYGWYADTLMLPESPLPG
ncbi:hypothetical protein ACYX7E_07535 [Luteimonas sp. RIT-PG2_3]